MTKALRSLDQWLPRRSAAPRPETPAEKPDLLRAAAEAGVKQTKDGTAFLRALSRAVGDRTDPRVAVLVSPGRRARELSDVLQSAYADARVSRVEVPDDWSRVHASLAAAGPFDVIVDDARRGRVRHRAAVFRRAFLHLESGGVTGSISVVHALMRADLVDEYRLFVYPGCR